MIINSNNINGITTIKIKTNITIDDHLYNYNFTASLKVSFNDDKIIKVICKLILPDTFLEVCELYMTWENNFFDGYSSKEYKIDFINFESQLENAIFNINEWSLFSLSRYRHGQHFDSFCRKGNMRDKIKEMVKICHDEINNPLVKCASKRC